MPATFALPGDVLAVQGSLIVWFPSGEVTRLAPGSYGLVSQSSKTLTLTALHKDKTGAMVRYGEPFTVSLSFLVLEAVDTTDRTFAR